MNEYGQPAPERGKPEPFWNVEMEIAEGIFFDERTAVRLKAHVAEERYSKSEGVELVVVAPRGARIYVMAQPYILEPDYQLTIGVYPLPTDQGAIGDVTASDWVCMRPRQIGQAQA
jgi:hypothetical protein